MATEQIISGSSGHLYTIYSSIALGIGITELVGHLIDDYGMLQEWRWANLSYFGARWSGMTTVVLYFAMACVGQSSPSSCYPLFVAGHVFCTVTSSFAASIFWTRAGVLCNWSRPIVFTLALYGIAILAFGLASSFQGFRRLPVNIKSPVCIITLKSTNQAIHRFLLASFDILTALVSFWSLSSGKSSSSWLRTVLLQDQILYVCAACAAYIGLGITFLTDSQTGRGLGLLCPSIISAIACRLFIQLKRMGKNNIRTDSRPSLQVPFGGTFHHSSHLAKHSSHDTMDGKRESEVEHSSEDSYTISAPLDLPRPATSNTLAMERQRGRLSTWRVDRPASEPGPDSNSTVRLQRGHLGQWNLDRQSKTCETLEKHI